MNANLQSWATASIASSCIKYKADILALADNRDLCRYRDGKFVGSLGGREVVKLDDAETKNAFERIAYGPFVYANNGMKILSLVAVISVFISKQFAILAAMGAVCCGVIFLLACRKLDIAFGEQCVLQVQKDIYDGIVKWPNRQGGCDRGTFDSGDEAKRQKYVPIIYRISIGEFMHPDLKRFRQEIIYREELRKNPFFRYGEPLDQVIDSIQCL